MSVNDRTMSVNDRIVYEVWWTPYEDPLVPLFQYKTSRALSDVEREVVRASAAIRLGVGVDAIEMRVAE